MIRRQLLTTFVRSLKREYTVLSNEVQEALKARSPIIALESTIVTHGMPYPDNLDMARSVEGICRNNGVTPATIAVLDGKIKIGVSDEELENLASTEATTKVSRRDIVPVLTKRGNGGTTVSSTMLLAHHNNIEIFATGGIGGVHRGGHNTLDVSADLTELARTPVTVICSGVKSILDIPRTLEYLETQGVTVATFGATRDFPAFFTAKSGYQSHENVISVEEAAELIYINQTMQIGSGMLIAVPIPQAHAAEGAAIERAIQLALSELEDAKISGNAVTPYVLKRVTELTCGTSLRANIALVKNNVDVASRTAHALSELRARYKEKRSGKPSSVTTDIQKRPLIIGAVNIDIICSTEADHSTTESSGKDLVAGRINHVFGGVARNVAECMARLCAGHQQPHLVSVIGDDKMGKMFLEHCKQINLKTDGVSVIPGAITPLVSLFLERGDVLKGVADFTSHKKLSKDLISEEMIRSGCPFVLVDCDTPLETISHIGQLCSKLNVPLVLEPTAPNKFHEIVNSGLLKYIQMLTPNLTELEKGLGINMEDTSMPSGLDLQHISTEYHPTVIRTLKYAVKCLRLMSHSPSVLITLGCIGAFHCSFTSHDARRSQVKNRGCLEIRYIPPAPKALMSVDVKSSSGAGDSFLGGYLSGFLAEADTDTCLKYGAYCAYQSLLSYDTVNDKLDPDTVVAGVDLWTQMDKWGVRTVFSGEVVF